MTTTQEVWDHHVQGFGERDVSMVLENDTEARQGCSEVREVVAGRGADGVGL